MLRVVNGSQFSPGDLVTLKKSKSNERYCILGFKKSPRQEPIAVLKALFNDTCIIEKPVSELNGMLIKGLL